MPRNRSTIDQVAVALMLAEGDAVAGEVRRRMGVPEPTFHRRKNQLVDTGVARIRSGS